MSELEPEETPAPVTEPAPVVEFVKAIADEALPGVPTSMDEPVDLSVLLARRITATFYNEQVADLLTGLLGYALVGMAASTSIKLFAEPGPRISMIRFDDEPLRVCLDRLAHHVSGRYEFAEGALYFKVG